MSEAADARRVEDFLNEEICRGTRARPVRAALAVPSEQEPPPSRSRAEEVAGRGSRSRAGTVPRSPSELPDADRGAARREAEEEGRDEPPEDEEYVAWAKKQVRRRRRAWTKIARAAYDQERHISRSCSREKRGGGRAGSQLVRVRAAGGGAGAAADRRPAMPLSAQEENWVEAVARSTRSSTPARLR